jgi:NAD(P)-dependent dehydrogenase (short-subunit alcohol dehydrogenase family)
METLSLDGKVAFVTGAASGIGRATAVMLASAGAKVMLVDIDPVGLEETAHLVAGHGGCATAQADLRVAGDVSRAVAATMAAFGHLDLAHNNAGIFGPSAPIVEYPAQAFEDVFRSNVLSVFLCMQAQIPHMVGRGGGVIVNTASAAGLRATANVSGYTTSKHALIGLTRVAALEYARLGVRINALCPGFVRTPMTDAMDDESKEAIRAAQPVGRVAEAHEIAEAVLWLFSDRAAFVAGASLVVDGGFTIS